MPPARRTSAPHQRTYCPCKASLRGPPSCSFTAVRNPQQVRRPIIPRLPISRPSFRNMRVIRIRENSCAPVKIGYCQHLTSDARTMMFDLSHGMDTAHEFIRIRITPLGGSPATGLETEKELPQILLCAAKECVLTIFSRTHSCRLARSRGFREDAASRTANWPDADPVRGAAQSLIVRTFDTRR